MLKLRISTLPIVALFALTPMAQAAVVITGVNTSLNSATSFTQTVPGAGSSNFPNTTNYTINYGQTNDLRMTGFTTGTGPSVANFTLNNSLQTDVFLRRASISGIPDHQQVVWYRTTANGQSGNSRNVDATYVPTLEGLLGGNIINRGTDNMFQNTGDGSGNINNIERVDFIFNGSDALTPQNQAHLDGVGFTVIERGGNDAIYVAAILGINENNDVTRLSVPAFVGQNGWGESGLWGEGRETLVLRDTAVPGEFRPSTTTGDGQDIHGIYFSLASLNVSEGDTVYGYALMAGDLEIDIDDLLFDPDTLLDWTDTDIFPDDTPAGPGGLDLVSGGSAFIDNELDTTGLFAPIPEPSAFALVAALGAFGYVVVRRRRSR